ncbi:MarR family transcriptional regulator [Halolamina salina]|uniref:MarR family transcriptional regulator n=1 Tax=Halolamina salina TaxID=1220023 RepID=A0ABD6B419_9EURY
MTQTQPNRADATTELSTEPPADVDSTAGKLVYVYLSSVVEATVDGIAEALDLKLIELLPTLRSLQSAGYVERAGESCRIVR